MMTSIIVSLVLGMQPVEHEPAMFRVGAWIPRLGGTIQDGGGTVDVETNIRLSARETVPLVEFSLQPIEDITLSFSVFDYSTSGSGLYRGSTLFGGMTLLPGDSWAASTSMQSVGFEAAWDVIEPFEGRGQTTLSFAPVIGLRWYGVDTTLQDVTSALSVTHNNGWVALQAGAQMLFHWDTRDLSDMFDSIAIGSQLMLGTLFGADGGSMWSMQAGLTAEFSPNVAGFFGYRLQELDAEDGAYIFNAGLQGLYIGGEIRF